MKKERIFYFDYIKAFLIFLVVLGHVMPEETGFHKYIYSWHMPAFFVINGMLLKYTEFDKKSFWGKNGIIFTNFKKLIIPYFFYGGLLLLFRWGNSGFDILNLKWQLIDLSSFSGIGATWFLPCLFIAQIVWFFIMRASSFFHYKFIQIMVLVLSSCFFFVLVVCFRYLDI